MKCRKDCCRCANLGSIWGRESPANGWMVVMRWTGLRGASSDGGSGAESALSSE